MNDNEREKAPQRAKDFSEDAARADFAEAETQRLREANAVLMEALVQVALICDSSYEATKAAVQAAIEKAKGVFE